MCSSDRGSEAVQKEMPVKLFLAGPSIDWYDNLYAQLSPQDKKIHH